MLDIDYSIRTTPLPNGELAIDFGAKTQFEPTHQNEIILMIDLSGSMQSPCSYRGRGTSISRRTAAIDSTEKLLDHLSDTTNIKIIGFDDNAEIIYSGQLKDANVGDIKGKLSSGFDRGTNFLNAIKLIKSQNKLEKSILLLTDGRDESRVSVSHLKEEANTTANQKDKKTAPIIAIGIGEGYNDRFLRELTDNKVFATDSSETLTQYFTSLLPLLQSTQACSFSVTINQNIMEEWNCKLLSNYTNCQLFTVNTPENGGDITATITQQTDQHTKNSSQKFTITQDQYSQHDAALLSEVASKETSTIFIDPNKSKQIKTDELSQWFGFLEEVSNQSNENKQQLERCAQHTRNLFLRTLDDNIQNDQTMMTSLTSMATNPNRLMTQTTATGCVTHVARHYGVSDFDKITDDFNCPIMMHRIAGKVINLPLDNGNPQYYSLSAIKGYVAATRSGIKFPHPHTREPIPTSVINNLEAITHSTIQYQDALISSLLRKDSFSDRHEIQHYIRSINQLLRAIGWLDSAAAQSKRHHQITETIQHAQTRMEENLKNPSGKGKPTASDVKPSKNKLTDTANKNNKSLEHALRQLDKQINNLQKRGLTTEKNILSRIREGDDVVNSTNRCILEKHRGHAPLFALITQTLTGIGFILGLINLAVNNRYTFSLFLPNTNSINVVNAVEKARGLAQ